MNKIKDNKNENELNRNKKLINQIELEWIEFKKR